MVRLSRFILEFRDLAEGIRCREGLEGLAIGGAGELGCDRFAALHTRSLFRTGAKLLRIDNYPANWDKALVIRGPKVIDPMIVRARRRACGLLWPGGLTRSLSDPERQIVEKAWRHGIRQGYTVPVNVPGEPEASVSFATRSTRRFGRERQLMAEAMGSLLFEAMRRVAGLASLPDPVPNITDRERECIYWIAHGKSDREIACILEIGVETVGTYVVRAFRKLGVHARAQLVHEALRRGVIDPMPSCPPFA